MTRPNHSSIAVTTTLTSAINSAVTTIPVAATTGWPAVPFYAVLTPGDATTEEIVLVTAAAGLNWTATRAQDSSTAKAHLIGATVLHAVVAADLGVGAELDTEITTRAAADTTLQTNITAEATARALADTTHAALTTTAHGGIVASTDPRLTDARTPTAHAASHTDGGSDEVSIDGSQVTTGTVVAARLPAASTTAAGISELATSAETTAGLAVQASDTRLSDSRAPSGTAGGVLSGTYPSPGFASDMATQAELDAAVALRLAIASNLSDLNNAGTARTNLGLGALAVLSSVTASLISDASANGRSLITAADYAAMKVLLALTIGTNVQAWDADLDTLAGMGATRAALLAALPAYIQTLLDDTDAATARATLVLGTAAVADTGTGAANVPTITQADARYQPLDADLTAIAALATVAYGRALLTTADQAALQTTIGLGALALLSSITASLISDASANGRSLITATNYAAMRTLLTLVVGTDVQAYDADLAALAALTSAADKLPYFTGSGTAALADLTSAARTVLDDSTTAAMLTTLGAQTAIKDGRAVISGVTQYTIPGVSLSTVSTRVMVASRIWYEPMVVRTTTTFDQMILEVQTAGSASTVIRMAIYACDTAHQPGARQVDAGTVAADSTGVKTASISLTLTPGLYLKACISDSTATLRTFRSGGPPSDFDTGLGTSPLISNIFIAGSGTTLPDPGTVWTGNNKTATGFEHTMLLRVSVP